MRDYNTHRVLLGGMEDSDEKIYEIFVNKNKELYADDPDFAASLHMPVISYKPERKYTGQITDDNAISVKEIDGKLMQVSRKSINELKKSDLDKLYTNDLSLKRSLEKLFEGKKDDYTVEKYLKDNGLSCFVLENGHRINKVTILSDSPARYYTKKISSNNITMLNDRKYYCIELYKTKDGKNNMSGIAMSDLIKKNGKLWLKSDYSYPEDYSKHIMYLFKGDYLKIIDSKNDCKFEGIYLSVKNINRNLFYNIKDNRNNEKEVAVSQKDKCIKLSVDILGNISGFNNGEGISCGEPLSLLKENE